MKSGRLARRLAATAGMGAIIAMGVLTACGQGEKAPETTTPTTTTTSTTTTAPPPPPAPTEKSINPTGGNLFTPPVKAPAPRRRQSPATTKRRTGRSGPDRGRRHRTAVPAVAKDATWPMAMFSADCMSLGSRPVCDSR